MSYCRWSTDIKNVIPFEEEMSLMSEGKSFGDIMELRIKKGGEISDWYIFWHCNSGDT